MTLIEWIESELTPDLVSSAEFIYEDVESQSGRCLPVIYQTFDPSRRSHWCDRGSILDFVCSCGNGTLLDFGPGDGWPSLLVAPYVKEVIGVDASVKRVTVCQENAARLAIANARFEHVPAGSALPFSASTFDGITAASSVEQTPDPAATLREFYRVLRPGGKLRLVYESLNQYKGGRERELAFWPLSADRCKLLIYDRRIEGETVLQYSFNLDMSEESARSQLNLRENDNALSTLTVDRLKGHISSVSEPRKCILRHPSGEAYVRMLEDVGFREVMPTQSGRDLAGHIFDAIPMTERPPDMSGVDEILLPQVEHAVHLAALLSNDPDITAIR